MTALILTPTPRLLAVRAELRRAQVVAQLRVDAIDRVLSARAVPVPDPPAALRSTRRRVAVCGTTGGFNAHRRRGEQPCKDCRKARQDYERDRVRRARASVTRGSL